MSEQKKPTEPEPQEVTVVNPEPIPVKIEVTVPPQPRAESSSTADTTAAKVAEVKEDKAAELVETALQLRLAAKDLADRLERADERKAQAEDKRASRLWWQAIILGSLVALPAIVAAWKTSETHEAVNSRMTEMKELIEKSSFAEGVLEGKGTKKDGP